MRLRLFLTAGLVLAQIALIVQHQRLMNKLAEVETVQKRTTAQLKTAWKEMERLQKAIDDNPCPII